jgi:prepilin-type N-terminal cleavage/methylation domain-containing protein
MAERRGTGGFTLLEVVLAMAALALMAAICYGAFHLGIRAVQRGELAVVTAERLRVAMDVLIRQIKSTKAQCATNREEETDWTYFTGYAREMRFTTAAGQLAGGGLVDVVYRVENGPTGPRLMMYETPHGSSDRLGLENDVAANQRSAVLLDNFRALAFQYHNRNDEDWQDAYVSSEDDPLPLPDAVRVTIWGLPGLDVDEWPHEIPIMTSMYVSGEAECDLDLENQPGATGTGTAGAGGTSGNNGSDEPDEPDEPDDPDE